VEGAGLEGAAEPPAAGAPELGEDELAGGVLGLDEGALVLGEEDGLLEAGPFLDESWPQAASAKAAATAISNALVMSFP